MLMDYAASRAKGKLNVHAQPRIVRESPVMARIDADAGLGHPAAAMGMEVAIAKAKNTGVGVTVVFNSHHFGAAGCYAAMAARAGMIGLVTSATRTINVVPTRGAVPVLGTNPIAFAAPHPAQHGVPARHGDRHDGAEQGEGLRPQRGAAAGWLGGGRDRHHGHRRRGRPGADRPARDTGGLTPLGGTADMASHKGYGLGMMAHILAGALAGASFSPLRVKTQKPEDPDNLGHFFLALDPAAFRDEGEFEDDLDAAIDLLHATKPADPALPVLVAGDPQARMRDERLRDGVPVPVTLVEKIRGVCEGSGAAFLLRN